METVCQVAFNLLTAPEARKAEAILREYLLRTSDQICMSRIGSSSFSIFSLIGHPLLNKRFQQMLKPEDVAEKNEQSWTFNLTENTKNLLNQATLFVSGKRRFFYGFSDPKFMMNGNEVAYMITTDRLLSLYIQDTDKAELASKGIYMDSPQV